MRPAESFSLPELHADDLARHGEVEIWPDMASGDADDYDDPLASLSQLPDLHGLAFHTPPGGERIGDSLIGNMHRSVSVPQGDYLSAPKGI